MGKERIRDRLGNRISISRARFGRAPIGMQPLGGPRVGVTYRKLHVFTSTHSHLPPKWVERPLGTVQLDTVLSSSAPQFIGLDYVMEENRWKV